MPELVEPTTRLHAAFLAAHAEWGPGAHEDGFGLGPEDDVQSTAAAGRPGALVEARALGIDPVQVVCEDGNAGSARVIERNGGLLEGLRDAGHGPVLQYRVDLTH